MSSKVRRDTGKTSMPFAERTQGKFTNAKYKCKQLHCLSTPKHTLCIHTAYVHIRDTLKPNNATVLVLYEKGGRQTLCTEDTSGSEGDRESVDNLATATQMNRVFV